MAAVNAPTHAPTHAPTGPVLVLGDDVFASAIREFLAASAVVDPVLIAPEAADLEERAATAGWIVEAAGPSSGRKRAVLARCASAGRALVTSDSSVVSRAELIAGLPAEFQARHAVAHFFFPLKHCRLVEVVTSSAGCRPLDDALATALDERLSRDLGRVTVSLPDCAGFCANRLGLHLVASALARIGATGGNCAVMDDLAISRLGLSRAGIFGIVDHVGVATVAGLMRDLRDRLPPDDPFTAVAGPALSVLSALREAGVERLVDRERRPDRSFRFPGEETASGAEDPAEALIGALELDRGRYADLLMRQNGIGPQALARIMAGGYGWSRAC